MIYMKKLLITGSSGMLGGNIVFELRDKYNIIGVYRNLSNPLLKKQVKLDLTKHNDVFSAINDINPDFVIHCAALTDIDKCEDDYSLARQANAITAKNLVSSLSPRTKLIYISTDSVFDGKQGNYNENDLPSPVNNYAKTKLEGEQFVEQHANNYVIIRTNIFGWNRVKERTSFAEWIYDNLRQGNQIEMFTDVLFSPISVNTLSLLIDKLLHINFVGRLNIGSNNSTSKYDFGVHLAKLFNFDSSLITPISVNKFPFKAKRPKNTSLNVSKAKDIFGYLPSLEEELSEFYKKREK